MRMRIREIFWSGVALLSRLRADTERRKVTFIVSDAPFSLFQEVIVMLIFPGLEPSNDGRQLASRRTSQPFPLLDAWIDRFPTLEALVVQSLGS